MRAKEYWVIMCSDIHDLDEDENLYSNKYVTGWEEVKFEHKFEALAILAELTTSYPNTCYTLYHLVPTEHTTHKR